MRLATEFGPPRLRSSQLTSFGLDAIVRGAHGFVSLLSSAIEACTLLDELRNYCGNLGISDDRSFPDVLVASKLLEHEVGRVRAGEIRAGDPVS
jgi:hypothetical protein